MNESPESPKASYVLHTTGNLIYAKFTGIWDTCIDLEFMTKLAEAMQKMRSTRWALVVDMREWHLPDEVIAQMQHAKVMLDRRNQVAECWLVSNEKQGSFLLPLVENASFTFGRFYSKADVSAFLRSFNMTCSELDTE